MILSTASMADERDHKAYQRIASLDLCMDWLLAYYADPSNVLALSPLHQRYPLPINTAKWPVHDGSLEQLVSLGPDLVIVGEFNALMLRSQLQRLGVNVEVLALPRSLLEVEEYLHRFTQLLGISTTHSNASISHLNTEGLSKKTPSEQNPRLLLLGANAVGTRLAELPHHIGLYHVGFRAVSQ